MPSQPAATDNTVFIGSSFRNTADSVGGWPASPLDLSDLLNSTVEHELQNRCDELRLQLQRAQEDLRAANPETVQRVAEMKDAMLERLAKVEADADKRAAEAKKDMMERLAERKEEMVERIAKAEADADKRVAEAKKEAEMWKDLFLNNLMIKK